MVKKYTDDKTISRLGSFVGSVWTALLNIFFTLAIIKLLDIKDLSWWVVLIPIFVMPVVYLVVGGIYTAVLVREEARLGRLLDRMN